MKSYLQFYSNPECEYQEAFFDELLCSSPVDGGVEGTDEEEWII